MNTTFSTTHSAGRRDGHGAGRRSIITRIVTGAGVGLVALAAAGSAALAGPPDDEDPVIPVVLADLPDVPADLGPAQFAPPVPPGDDEPPLPPDPPNVDVNPDLPIPDPGLADLPDPEPCLAWVPANTSVVHAAPVGGEVTVTISYSGDTEDTCNVTFAVHSIRLDEAMNPDGLVAEDHVSMNDLDANGGSVEVSLPIDPCLARVLTDGPDAYVLADTTYGEGCPEEPDPTDPTETPDPETSGDPGTPAPQLPATGSPSATIALVGAMFLAAGLGVACATRGSQVRHHER